MSVTTAPRDGAALLTVAGLLDSASYSTLRDLVIKAALAEPAAVHALATYPQSHRRRARANLSATPDSVSQSRQLVEKWLTAWSQTDLISVTKVIVTSLVENVLKHTDSPPGLRLESKGDTVTVAVEDDSRTWGTAPTPSGKTVWAVIGPENRL